MGNFWSKKWGFSQKKRQNGDFQIKNPQKVALAQIICSTRRPVEQKIWRIVHIPDSMDIGQVEVAYGGL